MDLVGPAFAREIMFTARRLNGAEALGMGLLKPRPFRPPRWRLLVREYALA